MSFILSKCSPACQLASYFINLPLGLVAALGWLSEIRESPPQSQCAR